MLKQQAKLFNRLSMVADACVICAALVLGYYFRTRFQGKLLPLYNYLWVLVVILPVWFYLLKRQGLYASIRRLSLFDIFSKLFNVHLLGGLLAASAIYFIDRDQYSRGMYLAFLCTSFLLLFFERIGVRLALGFYRKRGFNIRNLLIVGTREKARKFQRLVEDHSDWGLKIIGFVQADKTETDGEIEGRPVLGGIEDLETICTSRSVDEVVFCIPKDLLVGIEDSLQDLQELGITVRMVLDFYDLPDCKKDISLFHEALPVLTFHTKSLDAQQLFIKRILDILGALVGLGITGLLFPFIVFAIKKDSPGPIFSARKG